MEATASTYAVASIYICAQENQTIQRQDSKVAIAVLSKLNMRQTETPTL